MRTIEKPSATPLVDLDALKASVRGGGRLCRAWGANVSTFRQDRGLSQRQLAELTNTTKGSISKIESGSLEAGSATKIAIAWALGTTAERLFPWPAGDVLAEYLAETDR